MRSRVDDQAVDEAGGAAQHEVAERRSRRADHALDRRVRDVALVPQRHVLERRRRRSARSRRASPYRFSDRIGFFLCGIAEEPFCPLPKASFASPTSVRCQWRTWSADALDARCRARQRGEVARRGDRARRSAWRPSRAAAPARPAPRSRSPGRGWRRCRRRRRSCRPRSSRARASRRRAARRSSA